MQEATTREADDKVSPDTVPRQRKEATPRASGKRLTAPGVPFSPASLSKEYYLTQPPNGSTIADGQYEGVMNSHIRTVVEPAQDQSKRETQMLVQKLRDGQMVRFESKEERQAVVEAVWESKRPSRVNGLGEAARGREAFFQRQTLDERSDATKKANPIPFFRPLPKAVRANIVDRVVKGVYDAEGRLDGKHKQPVLNEIAKMTMKNGTYLIADGDRFLRKVQSLLPALQTQKSAVQQRQKQAARQ